jgi:sugar O-acyltransferase (sialic acid O-acetyltransferase NeuD family)
MNLIFGASGHATEIEWLSQVCTPPVGHSYRADYFVVPDAAPQTMHVGLPVISESEALQIAGPFNGFIAVGQVQLRHKIWQKFDCIAATWPVLQHPSVVVDSRPGTFDVGQGSILFPGCTLTSQIKIGCHVHINVGCSISHDVSIGNFCTLSPGVRLAGKVCLGERVFLGMGALVAENIRICADATIGAGAVVLRDIDEPGTYVGIPARRLHEG